MKKFLRRETSRHSKLGKNRKKLQKWRKPKGRDNKMRLKQKAYPKSPSIGYKSSMKTLSTKPTLVKNINDLSKLNKDSRVIIAKVGAKKKIEIIKKSSELNLRILNVKGVKQ